MLTCWVFSADSALKKQQQHSAFSKHMYLDFQLLFCTSNICEHLFSKSDFVFYRQIKDLFAASLKYQLFVLSKNDPLEPRDITKALKTSGEETL